MGDELALMWRDVTVMARAGLWPVLLGIFGLPAASLALLALRQWFALLPTALSLVLGALWFTYYARDWTEESAGEWSGFIALGLCVGWLFVFVCAIAWRLARRS